MWRITREDNLNDGVAKKGVVSNLFQLTLDMSTKWYNVGDGATAPNMNILFFWISRDARVLRVYIVAMPVSEVHDNN